jgi:hypothetical protein
MVGEDQVVPRPFRRALRQTGVSIGDVLKSIR